MPAASDFRLYHSNALDVLAGILAELLRTPAPGASLLEPEVVLIPQPAMRRWLQAVLAQRHGVAANIDFVTPGEFVARALDANLGKAEGDPDQAMLKWRLYAALTDPAVLALPAMAQLAAHVAGDDPLKAWALAGELATVFERYQAWRRDWLLRWEAGADPDDPQAILWRRVAGGAPHRARRIQQYLDRFEGDDRPLPAGLPKRLSAFATLNVSPDVLRVLATQARVGTLHFFVPSPAKDFWGDLQRVRAGPDGEDADESRLLQAWGAAGRDFMAVIGGYELVHPSEDLRAPVDPLEGGGALQGSLLRRLQSDVFQRRGDPPLAPTGADPRRRLPQVRKDDPSLQVHACHTRLRELQVLHDQLRALFEDPRFDPPLQPRDVAVLAPDIDPYIPYLDAVFGSRDQDDAIPYALADTSPLAGEPLADVFLRLLALPVSRFGLREVLDLLACPPLAEAAGLEPAAFEQLHGWLVDAGARWGLDAAHRERSGAPRDTAYTWQFALDRLLLGMASGCDDPIAGVVPLPVLEGGAAQALDRLLRMLRVLSRGARELGEAIPPAQWRERLLALLDALLPRAPGQASTQRALDRLRSLIDDFAREAERAGYEAPVPAEAVRAHFATVLAEADTRAPLLTGGVSIARMVPMRLLPFRVICVLGMDDGEFPRRDPASGLNRLTAAIGTDQRRVGDRSTREDDRYLFLQLFSAAQDVFYVSYRGHDPRDGSVREPSLLVADLLAAAAAQHAPEVEALEQLVVHHPLQPFSPQAFGSGDEPRRFSYRRAWWEAAARAAEQRVALPPWFEGAPMAGAEDAEPTLSLDVLRSFLLNPAEAFLRQRLALRLPELEEADPDIEPLLAPSAGLARHALQQAVFQAALRGDGEARVLAELQARGLLPSGPLGLRALRQVREDVEGYAQVLRDWRGAAAATAQAVEVELDGTTLRGRIGEVYPGGIARLRFGQLNGNAVIRSGLDWLLASAAGLQLPLARFHDAGEEGGLGPHLAAPLPVEQARTLLRRLLALRAQGLREPLPFAPYSAWALYQSESLDKGLRAAEAKWRGNGIGFAERQNPALELALRGRDLFRDRAICQRFADLAFLVYDMLLDGRDSSGNPPVVLPDIVFEGEDA